MSVRLVPTCGEKQDAAAAQLPHRPRRAPRAPRTARSSHRDPNSQALPPRGLGAGAEPQEEGRPGLGPSPSRGLWPEAAPAGGCAPRAARAVRPPPAAALSSRAQRLPDTHSLPGGEFNSPPGWGPASASEATALGRTQGAPFPLNVRAGDAYRGPRRRRIAQVALPILRAQLCEAVKDPSGAAGQRGRDAARAARPPGLPLQPPTASGESRVARPGHPRRPPPPRPPPGAPASPVPLARPEG